MNLLRILGVGLLLWGSIAMARAEEKSAYFGIQIVDAETGRGVPLVELETLNQLRFVTDSAGWAAIAEPDLFGKSVWFHVRSHGYELAADGFAYRGKTWNVEAGQQVRLALKRRNLAERLYRITGSGIYRDSVLLGQKPLGVHPLQTADVWGCDSVMSEVYRGKIYWFWGDTFRSNYPLGGNFHITGGTSRLPAEGGLSPDRGIDVRYFTDPAGKTRPLAEMPGEGPTWIAAVTTLRDPEGTEQLLASYVKIRNQLESYRWGFVIWNDQAERFEQVREFTERPAVFLEPQAHPLRHRDNGVEYIYFCDPLPLTRVRAESEAYLDPTQYEGFAWGLTAENSVSAEQKDSDSDKSTAVDAVSRGSGPVQNGFAWRKNVPPTKQKQQTELIAAGKLSAEAASVRLRDIQTGRPVQAHSGSVEWNPYRERWGVITVELEGKSSLLGEVWYAEADAPTGPWVYARKIVTHERYSFYNPKQHAFLAQEEGRFLYFEGTYTHSFSGNPVQTPRYDYNQIMYRLDLSLPELNLPVAYTANPDRNATPFVTVKSSGSAEGTSQPTFFACERAAPGTRPVLWQDGALLLGAAGQTGEHVVFHAVPNQEADAAPGSTPLYEFKHTTTGERVYHLDHHWQQADFVRSTQPICHVWRGF